MDLNKLRSEPVKPVETAAFKPTDKSWTPTIVGAVGYCSPACGGHRSGVCTINKFNSAVEKADKFAVRMGAPWKPRVWENLGWHYEIERPNCTINEHSENSYWIDLQISGLGQIAITVTDPVAGYHEALSMAQAKIENAQKDMAEM